jgi:type II secretory pathway predicted ATPase ExeA/predicted regulator of Ras-like GTPase activity (Roadblock/LC7/MglB family)
MANPTLELQQIDQSRYKETLIDVRPKANFYYPGPDFKRLESTIAADIRGYAGLIVLTGEVGTGKTLVIRHIVKKLDATIQPVLFSNPRFTFAEFIGFACEELGLFNNPRFTFAELIDFACRELGLKRSERSVDRELQGKLKVFQRYLDTQGQQKRSVAFFIDNAQEVSEEVLVELLRLAKPQTTGEHTLQLILVGLPELETLLCRPRLQELIRNSLPPYRLNPLKPEEVGDFIAQKLSASAGQREDLFSPQALAKIASYSRGIARLINVLCDSAMFTASLKNREQITADIVEEAVEQLCSLTLATAQQPSQGPQGETAVVHTHPAFQKQTEEDRDQLSLTLSDGETASLIINSSNEQEQTMNRTESLNKVLKNLQTGSPDVEASALISEDGLMIASALPQDLDETRVAGMSATLLNLGTRAAVELRRGEVQEVIVRGLGGYAVMITAGRGVLLLVLTNENAKLGLVFFDMREAIGAIKRIL